MGHINTLFLRIFNELILIFRNIYLSINMETNSFTGKILYQMFENLSSPWVQIKISMIWNEDDIWWVSVGSAWIRILNMLLLMILCTVVHTLVLPASSLRPWSLPLVSGQYQCQCWSSLGQSLSTGHQQHQPIF